MFHNYKQTFLEQKKLIAEQDRLIQRLKKDVRTLRFIQSLDVRKEAVLFVEKETLNPFVVTLSLDFNRKGSISWINLYGYTCNAARYQSDFYLYAWIAYDAEDCPVSVTLEDIRGNTRYHGYGSYMMTVFLQLVRQIKGSHPSITIHGQLSLTDIKDQEHPYHERVLLHFYRKFGFDIDENNHLSLTI